MKQHNHSHCHHRHHPQLTLTVVLLTNNSKLERLKCTSALIHCHWNFSTQHIPFLTSIYTKHFDSLKCNAMKSEKWVHTKRHAFQSELFIFPLCDSFLHSFGFKYTWDEKKIAVNLSKSIQLSFAWVPAKAYKWNRATQYLQTRL